jgi:hypothetical protein
VLLDLFVANLFAAFARSDPLIMWRQSTRRMLLPSNRIDVGALFALLRFYSRPPRSAQLLAQRMAWIG